MVQNQNKIGFKYGTYAEYLALPIKDVNTIYFTTNPERIYKGEILYTASQSVKYMTVSQYNELVRNLECDASVIYLVIDDNTNRLKYIYVGYILIGESASDGSIGFPYIFPITF